MEDEGGGQAQVEGGQVGLERDRGEPGCRAEEGRLGLKGKPQDGS